MSSILYTVARDNSGKLIKANDAEKGHDFFCPVCNTELTLRKSGNTGKGARRPHFAHRVLPPNCNPETALHDCFKNLLADKIQEHLASQEPLPISWRCKYCNGEHSRNLLEKINTVKVEHDMTVCRPDIALLDENGNVLTVIEIVVTHEPNKSILTFYDENDITLIKINLESDKDIDELENKIAKPEFVGSCLNPKCKNCGGYKQNVTMIIADTPCQRCGSAMKVAIIRKGETGLDGIRPDEFYPQERDLARSRGALINKMPDTNFFANICSQCGMYVSEGLLLNILFLALKGKLPSEKYDMDYRCSYCATVNENTRLVEFYRSIAGKPSSEN